MVKPIFPRNALTFFTALRPASRSLCTNRASIFPRLLSHRTPTTAILRRPTIGVNSGSAVTVAGRMEIVKASREQIRGMKVRSSVKKLCEGCKACYITLSQLNSTKHLCDSEILRHHEQWDRPSYD
jgi:hypothetical protein